jgi:multiple sugar transport system substrate-binding protein
MKDEKKITRRKFIKDSAMAAAGVSALAVGTTSGLNLFTREAHAQSDLRAAILKIPGVGMGSPTDLVHPEQCV